MWLADLPLRSSKSAQLLAAAHNQQRGYMAVLRRSRRRPVLLLVLAWTLPAAAQRILKSRTAGAVSLADGTSGGGGGAGSDGGGGVGASSGSSTDGGSSSSSSSSSSSTHYGSTGGSSTARRLQQDSEAHPLRGPHPLTEPGRAVLLFTQLGSIRIRLLERLAPRVTALVWDMAAARNCSDKYRCALYRNEARPPEATPLGPPYALLQGRLYDMAEVGLRSQVS